ncbi:hypothetical protein K802_20460, partial [Salmonella enterica subsp. enterica serovar Newport str. SHSN012]
FFFFFFFASALTGPVLMHILLNGEDRVLRKVKMKLL